LLLELIKRNTNFLKEASMITEATLRSLANTLGILSMIAVVAYHIVSVNAQRVLRKGVAEAS